MKFSNPKLSFHDALFSETWNHVSNCLTDISSWIVNITSYSTNLKLMVFLLKSVFPSSENGTAIYLVTFFLSNSISSPVILIGISQMSLLVHLYCHQSSPVKVKAQSCMTLCDPMDYSPSGSSAHGILQARILEWIAIPFSRGSSPPRDWTQSPVLRLLFYHLSHEAPEL